MEYRSHNYCKTSDTSFIKKEHKKVKGMDTRTFIISQYVLGLKNEKYNDDSDLYLLNLCV